MAERRVGQAACTPAANPAGRRGPNLGGRLRCWQHWLREPCLTALVVLELGVILVVVPLTATGLLAPSVLHLLRSLLIVAAVVVVSRYRVAVVIMVGATAVGWS